MTIDTVELRKIQYAQELAAYTMRQWMLMRDSPDPKHGSVAESTNGPTSAAQTTTPSSGRDIRGDISRCPSPTCTWLVVDSLLPAAQHAPNTPTKP